MTSGYRRRLTIHGTGQEGTIMSVEFDEDTGTLLDGKNFATVATLNEDGSPHTSVVWITRDGNTVLFTTTAGSRKGRNLARDPRISLTVIDAQNPYHSVDIRGATELTEDRDKSLPRRLSHKYLGEDPPTDPEHVVRLTVRVTPQKVTGFSLLRVSQAADQEQVP
jgi:PPOX class probable F420-dependent enzyme